MAEIFCGDRRAEAAGPVPRGIGAADWDLVSAGVRQRVLVLEAFLADVYGPGRAFDDGVVPWRALFTSGTFRREAAGLTPPNGVRVHLAGIDLVRDERGGFWVLGDNVCVPSGDGYLLADRLACARLLGALRAAAPRGVADPLVVMLTPGAHDDAYLEHALLARHMGVELVEGRDLSCRHGRVYAHTTRGSRPVDVIWRRVDDDWLDPLHFRPDSPLGCPGLVNAARRGTVTIANGIGNGVAQDRLVYPYLPDLIRYYLAEDPILDNAGPGRLGNRDVLRTFAVNDGTGIWVLPGGVTPSPVAWERGG